MQVVKHHKESFFHTRFWIVVLLFLVIIFGMNTLNMYKKYAHAKKIRDEVALELVNVQNNKEALERNIESLSTDRGKEAEVRDRYRVVKEGEQMILIVDNEDSEENHLSNETILPETEKAGILEEVANFFQSL